MIRAALVAASALLAGCGALRYHDRVLVCYGVCAVTDLVILAEEIKDRELAAAAAAPDTKCMAPPP